MHLYITTHIVNDTTHIHIATTEYYIFDALMPQPSVKRLMSAQTCVSQW